MANAYNRQQLDKLLEMHMSDQAITYDDRKLLSSALHFSSKVVEEIMTPLKDVFAISVTDNLDFDDLKAIYVSGYTRIPVYHNRRDTIVGIVYTKDLILVDPNDEIPVASILPFCSRDQLVRQEHDTGEAAERDAGVAVASLLCDRHSVRSVPQEATTRRARHRHRDDGGSDRGAHFDRDH